jgi:hypothetical protein
MVEKRLKVTNSSKLHMRAIGGAAGASSSAGWALRDLRIEVEALGEAIGEKPGAMAKGAGDNEREDLFFAPLRGDKTNEFLADWFGELNFEAMGELA